jgi:tetratricopeptide (TPR) repeat protein
MRHNMKRTVIFIAALLILGIVVFVVVVNKKSNLSGFGSYDAGTDAEKRHTELLNKFQQGHDLTSREVNILTAYYISSSKYDEGITVLEKIAKKQDGYMTYYGLSVLYGSKAKLKKVEREDELIKRAHFYLKKGFTAAPEKPLAYYSRGQTFAILGCFEMAIDDLRHAIEESKKTKIIMLEEGISVDQQKFTAFVEKEIARLKNFRSDCLLKEIK